MNATEPPFREHAAWRGRSIEIVAPDRYCTAMLLEQAAPLFAAEVVYGIDPQDGAALDGMALDGAEAVDQSAWIVRIEPPAGRDWAVELLTLVENWLESCRLPCAKVLYGGRGYLIRASTDGAWFQAAAESSKRLPAQG
jgi:hypothetical protein